MYVPPTWVYADKMLRLAFDNSMTSADIERVHITKKMETRTMTDASESSNTGNSHSNFDPAIIDDLQTHLGIDKMKIRFPIESSAARRLVAMNSPSLAGFYHHLPQWGHKRLSNERLRLWTGGVSVHPDRPPSGIVEFNPSRWIDPTGWTTAPLTEIGSVVDAVWESIAPVFEPTVNVSEAEVRRLDIARDFTGVERPNRYLMRLDTNARAVKMLNRTHYVSTVNDGWTIQLTNGSGKHMRMYDKHHQSGGRAPFGSIRFEVELHKWLTNHGSNIRTIADITPWAVSQTARYWWRESCFGVPLAPSDEIFSHIAAVLEGRRNIGALATSVYGYYRRKQDGDETLDLSSGTRRLYEDILRQAETALLQSATSEFRALDLDAGTEVVSGA